MESEQSSTFTLSPSVSIIVAGVIIAGAVIFASKQPAQPVATNPEPQAAPAVDVSKVKIDGEPFIGNANAPVTIAYWYDYQCPYCQRNEETAMPQLIKEYVDTGKAKIVFKDYQFLGEDSQTAGLASRAVWEAAPQKFYEWHKAMFDKQDAENSGWGTKADILALTKTILGAADTDKVSGRMASQATEYQKEMDADKAEGTAMGVNGTPASIIGTQLISGAQPYAAFQAAIEIALRKK